MKEKTLGRPFGLNEIINTFGDVSKFIEDDGIISVKEELVFLDYLILPYPMLYAYNTGIKITRIRCHKLMVPIFRSVFEEIKNQNMQHNAMYFGGCYNFRSKRLGHKLSTHAWGIAIDLNPLTNRMGTKGDMNSEIIKIFRQHNFVWGGYWKTPDPMHFQYAAGY